MNVVMEEITMNIIEEIEKLKDVFQSVNNQEPNCVKVGKKETQELENWYNLISKPESNAKKVKINNGAVIMGLCIIKTKDKTFLEVAKENLDSKMCKMVILNPNAKAIVEVNNEEGNKQTI